MKQLGITDSAFINLEHPNTPQHIGSFGIYDQSTAPEGKVRFKQLIGHFERQIKKMPLFRTRLIGSPGGFARPYWHVDEDFDVEFHVRHVALPAPGDWRQLCILIARLHSRPLDMSRPLWESYIIEGLDNIEHLPKGCFVIFNKLHHALIDGDGASGFMQAIHDLEPIAHDHTGEEQETFAGDLRLSKSKYYKELTRNYFNNAWEEGKGAVNVIGDAAKSAIKLSKGELPPPPLTAPETRFNQPVSPHRVIEGAILSLDDFKFVKNKTQTKINDVALTVISGAMAKYLKHHNETPETSLVATVPMNMRSRRSSSDGDNNQVGSMFTSLNSHIEDPVKRIIAIHHSSDDAKLLGENSPLADTLKLAGALSPRLTKRLVNLYVDNKLTQFLPLKVNTVVSNVPGPPIPLYASGAKLMQYHGVGVLTPGVGLFHLVFSYLKDISITILADRNMMPDPDFYRQCIDESMEELKAAVEATSEEEIARMIAQEMGTVMPEAQPLKTHASLTKPERKRATRKKAEELKEAKAEAKAEKAEAKSEAKETKAKAKTAVKTKAKAKPRAKLKAKASASSKSASSKPEAEAAVKAAPKKAAVKATAKSAKKVVKASATAEPSAEK